MLKDQTDVERANLEHGTEKRQISVKIRLF